MKIDKKFMKQLSGSLSKDKLESKSEKLHSVFSIINSKNPDDNKIDIEEITQFTNSIWNEDDGDGNLSDKEIDSYIQKNKALFKGMDIRAKDIKQFLEFFVKNSDKSKDYDTRITNKDGTYSIITRDEEFETKEIIQNSKEIEQWKRTNQQKNQNNQNNIFSVFSKQSDKTEQPKPIYKTIKVAKGFVDKKINYSAKNEILSIEETRNGVTNITDSQGKILKNITKNNNAKDTIKEYTYLEDGTREEAIFYGENGVKDSETPVYKNLYNDNKLVSRYEYDTSGQITQRLDYTNSTVTSVTRYENGLETQTVQLFTNTRDFASPDLVFDNIIDPSKQNYTGDCYLLNGLSMMSKTTWGRDAIANAISQDSETGDITIKFKHAYGETKEFTITQEELLRAKKEKRVSYNFSLDKGNIVYIDGKQELVISKDTSFSFDAESVQSNITFVCRNGEKYIWPKNVLEESEINKDEGPKYSSGDLTTLAFELAVEKSRAEAGLSLDSGNVSEVLSLLTDEKIKYSWIDNNDIVDTKSIVTNSEKKKDVAWRQKRNELESYLDINILEDSSLGLINTLNKIKVNPDKYMAELVLKMGEGLHAGQLVRFEERDGKTYILYTHSWDDKAEIAEELEGFVKKSLAAIELFEKEDNNSIQIDSDSQIGNFRMGTKSNRTNFASAMAALGQNPDFKPDISKDENNNYVVKIKDKSIVITPNELQRARTSGFYSTSDDDIPILELAVERYINSTRHNNTMYELTHTNLEDVKLQDIMNLFSDKELTSKSVYKLSEASKIKGSKFVRTHNLNGDAYYAVKEIKLTPDGSYQISVIQPEDTSIVVTYPANEFHGEIIAFEANNEFGV